MKTQTLAPQLKPDMLALRNVLVPLDFSPPSNKTARKETIIEPAPKNMTTRLARHPFLAGMNQRHLGLLKDCARAVQFLKGQVIFREGDVADRFYLIETGKVSLESSGGLGDPMLGWAWMFPPHVWTFTARTVEATTAIFFDGAILQEYCEKDHSFGYEFLKRMNLVMYQRMQAARNTMPTIHHRSDTLTPAGLSPFMDPELVPYPGADGDRQSCAQTG